MQARFRLRARRTAAVLAAGLPALAHFAPSTAVLGQWAPRVLQLPPELPGGLCRWRGPGAPAVALTFDDGPAPESTPAVLGRLEDLGVKATFFVLGELAREHPDLVRRTVDAGHEIGLHGMRHVHHLLRTVFSIERDLAEGLDVLEGLGVTPRFFRPPYGQLSGGTVLAARRHRLETVLWSAWGREWRDRVPSSVAGRVSRHLGPGSIVLLHDSDHTAPAGTWQVGFDALPLVVEDCERRGLRLVTLSELVGPPAA